MSPPIASNVENTFHAVVAKTFLIEKKTLRPGNYAGKKSAVRQHVDAPVTVYADFRTEILRAREKRLLVCGICIRGQRFILPLLGQDNKPFRKNH
jgi:hypothetical protein